MIKSFWRNLQAPLTTLLAALILCALVGGPTALLCWGFSSASYLYWTTWWWSASSSVLSINFVGGCGVRLKKITNGIIAILLIINLGGCSNMTNTQKENNVIAGTIPNEITADWFNTKANEADCKLSVPRCSLRKVPSKVSAATSLSARASRRLAGSGTVVRYSQSRTTLQVSAPPITAQQGRALGLRLQETVFGRRSST